MQTLKNITFSAQPDSIERARLRAAREHTTLNEKFREWLDGYAMRKPTVDEYRKLMKDLRHVDAGRKYSRQEMNARSRQS